MIRPRLLFALALGISAAVPTAAAGRPAAGGSPAAVGPGPGDDDDLQEVLVELRFGRMVARTIAAYRLEDAALLPLPDFFRLAEIQYEAAGDSSITAILQPGDRRVRFTLDAPSVSVDGREVSLDPNTLILRRGVLYLDTKPLGQVLGLRLVADWSEVYVIVENPEALPVVRRLQRAAARRAVARSARPVLAESNVQAPRTGVNGMVVDYAWLLPGDNPLGGSHLLLSLGTNAFGGSLELETQSHAAAGEFRVNGLWTGIWPDNPRLRQVRVGDGVATGPRARAIRGLALTNAPWIRTPAFGTATYDGTLPAGWEVEAYRGGRLVAYDSVGALGRFGFDLPVERGENPLELVAYGPYGEIRRFNQTYRVDREILAPGRWEYGVSGGQCRTDRCGGMVNADLRYGLSRRVTLGAGIDQYWRGDASDVAHPYAGIVATPMNALSVTAEGAVNAFARGAIRFEPSLDLRVAAEHTRYSQALADPIIIPAGTHSRTTVLGFLRPISAVRSFYLSGQFDHSVLEDGSLTTARLGVANRVQQFTLIPYLRWQDRRVANAVTSEAFAGLDAIMLPQRSWGRIFHGLSARGTIETTSRASVSVAAANLAYNIRTGTRIEGGVRWFGNGQGTTMTLGISSTLGNVSSDVSMSAPSTGGTLTTTSFRGSVIYNATSRSVAFSPVNSIQRSGVTGVVFLDANTNGLQDPGERGIPGVRVMVGFASVRTDSTGRYQAWDAAPYQAVIVSVDSLSLPNPLWVSRFGAVSTEPGPNTYTSVDLPVVASAVLEGRVRLARPGTNETDPAGHLDLVLIERGSGHRQRVRTFSDGGFYLMGVRPGRYTLTVDEPSAARFLPTSPLELAVEALPGGAVIDGLELLVAPVRP